MYYWHTENKASGGYKNGGRKNERKRGSRKGIRIQIQYITGEESGQIDRTDVCVKLTVGSNIVLPVG